MSSGKCTTIPRSFSWVLPGQSLVTGVAIYSTVYVFRVGSKVFILAVAAAGIQFLLGLYSCFTANKPGIHHAIVMPVLLAGIGGVWCGPLYYFARVTDFWLKVMRAYPKANSPAAATWSYVGLAASCLNVIIALGLLTLFLVKGLQAPKPTMANYFEHGYATGTVQPAPDSNPNAYTYQQAQPQHPYHQQQQPYPVPGYTTTATVTSEKYLPTTTTTPISPLSTPSPFQPQTQTQPVVSYPNDPSNRITTIKRICALQSPAGNWTYSPELASLVRHWTGRDLAAATGNDDRLLTLAVNDCLRRLCEYVWAAQGDRAEAERLSPAEMTWFQGLGWDLGFAKVAMERAGRCVGVAA